jgi:hypothetical protein
MRTRFLPGLVLICLAATPFAARAADPKPLPSFVARMKSIDGLLDDLKYIAKLANKENEAVQLERMLRDAGDKNGLEGIDVKKPIALYGRIGANLADSEIVVMLPVADEKAFLALLNRYEVKADKDKDGIYTVKDERLEQAKVSAYFRFANNYAYITANNAKFIAKDKLMLPAQVLPTDKLTTLSLTLSIDQIPEELKQIALGQFELHLGNAKEETMPNETEAQKKFRIAALDETAIVVKQLLTDGQDLSLSFDIDRKTEDISLALTLSGKSGSALAKSIEDLGKAKSIGAGLIGPDSAMNMLVYLMMSDTLKKAFEPVIDEGFKKALETESDKTKRAIANRFLKLIDPTFKSGELDLGLNLRGPNANGFYAGVGALKLKNGLALEKEIKDLLKDAPAEDKKDLDVDFEKVKDVSIHRIRPGKDYSDDAKKIFGENPVYVAFRDDAIFLSMGEGGLAAIKDAITGQAKPSKTLQFEIAMGRIAKLAPPEEQPETTNAAKKAFATAKNGDRITLSVEGGKSLKLRAAMKAQVVTFFALVAEAQEKKKAKGFE